MKFLVEYKRRLLYGLAAALFLCSVGSAVYVGYAHRNASIEATRVAHAGAISAASSLGPPVPAIPRRASVEDVKPVVSGMLSVPILMYHHVGSLPQVSDALRRDLTVSVENFEAQVAWLSQRGYTAVSLAEIYEASQGRFTLPSASVAFTFDDGYADVFQNAVPILQKYGMRGSFAVVPGFLGQPDYATWDMVQIAHAAGMEIVSHTENHFDGGSPKFDAKYIQENLEQSLRDLEIHVGPVPRILVYPYGHYTPEYISVAQKVGFVMALTTKYGRQVDPQALMHTPRVRVHGNGSIKKFEESIAGGGLGTVSE